MLFSVRCFNINSVIDFLNYTKPDIKYDVELILKKLISSVNLQLNLNRTLRRFVVWSLNVTEELKN